MLRNPVQSSAIALFSLLIMLASPLSLIAGTTLSSGEGVEPPEPVVPMTIEIDWIHGSLRGIHQQIDVTLSNTTLEVGGFDLLLGYDAEEFVFMEATPGDLLNECGWEYFTYRYSHYGAGDLPSGQVRVVGIAETNNGDIHPTCFMTQDKTTLFSLDLLILGDHNFDCYPIPIRFLWYDCMDNTVSTRSGDTLLISHTVYDYYHQTDVTDSTHTRYPSMFGAGADCTSGSGTLNLRGIDFRNGGVDLVCTGPLDLRGDMNLNGVPYEVGDAVVLSNYFVYGLSAFEISLEGQIAQSDINKDGLTLTVADLYYLLRIINGDTDPIPKPVASTATVEILATQSYVQLTASDLLGAIHLIFDGEIVVSGQHPKLNLAYHFDGEMTRVLVHTMDPKKAFGTGRLFDLTGDGQLLQADATTNLAGPVKEKILLSTGVEGNAPTLPNQFTVSQNHPNPFNMETVIEFTLPRSGEVTFEIFNLLGKRVYQKIATLPAGYHQFNWDGRSHGHDVASGVYYYRLSTDNFSDTKKMMLLK